MSHCQIKKTHVLFLDDSLKVSSLTCISLWRFQVTSPPRRCVALQKTRRAERGFRPRLETGCFPRWFAPWGATWLAWTWRILFNKTELWPTRWKRSEVTGRVRNTGRPGGSSSWGTSPTTSSSSWTSCSRCPWCGPTTSSSAVGA